jgi:DNA-binding transcriptional LysR family regulator
MAPNDRLLCASPDFMRGRTLSSPQDLLQVPCLALRENDEDVTLWRFSAASARRESIRIRPVLSCNDGEVVRSWALGGSGVAMRSEWDVAGDLLAGRLVRVLPEWSLPTADIVVLVAHRGSRVERVKRFIAAMREALQPPPWRTEVSAA